MPFGGAVHKAPVTSFKGICLLWGQTFCKTMEYKLLKDMQTKLAEVQVDQRYSQSTIHFKVEPTART